MDPTPVIDALRRDLPEVSVEAGRATDQPTIYVPRAPLVEIGRVLRDRHRFRLLADLTAVDWQPREPRFEVTYHLVRLGGELGPARLRIKTRVPGAEARVPTVAGVWPAAGWLEREVWDLFGIVFDDHPDLRRLLMPEDWEGHPLRKDYPVQVMTRPRSEQPLQVTPEEFVRNIERTRKQS